MGKMNFGAARDRAEREGLIQSGGDYLKLKSGDNRLRILTAPLAHAGEYNGKPNFKWMFYVLDRTDGQVKPMFMSPVIFDMLVDLQQDPDYEFDEAPMPYDVNIKATNAGTISARYSVVPSPKRAPLTDQETAHLEGAMPLHELQEKILEKAKSRQQPPESSTTFDPESVPF